MLKPILYALQTLIIVLWTLPATVVIASIVILYSFFSRTGNGPHLLARFWANSILWVSRVKVTITGAEKLDPDRSYIYMPNHQSNADIPLLLGRLPVQFRWLAKAELFRIPIFGRAMRGWATSASTGPTASRPSRAWNGLPAPSAAAPAC